MSEQQHEQDGQGGGGPVISEGGSAAQNPTTSHGGADSVPDTPDVNTEISDTVDANEQGQEDDAPGLP